MNRTTNLTAIAVALFSGYVLAASPNYAAPNPSAGRSEAKESAAGAQMLAQANPAQEQQLMQQIEADTAKLKADEAAEKAGKVKLSPQQKFIADAIHSLHRAVKDINKANGPNYQGRRNKADQAIAEAHRELMECYRIASNYHP